MTLSASANVTATEKVKIVERRLHPNSPLEGSPMPKHPKVVNRLFVAYTTESQGETWKFAWKKKIKPKHEPEFIDMPNLSPSIAPYDVGKCALCKRPDSQPVSENSYQTDCENKSVGTQAQPEMTHVEEQSSSVPRYSKSTQTPEVYPDRIKLENGSI